MGRAQHGQEVALGDLTAAAMARSSGKWSQAFPCGVVCCGRISESHTEWRFFPNEDVQAVEQIAQLHRAFSSLELSKPKWIKQDP